MLTPVWPRVQSCEPLQNSTKLVWHVSWSHVITTKNLVDRHVRLQVTSVEREGGRVWARTELSFSSTYRLFIRVVDGVVGVFTEQGRERRQFSNLKRASSFSLIILFLFSLSSLWIFYFLIIFEGKFKRERKETVCVCLWARVVVVRVALFINI